MSDLATIHSIWRYSHIGIGFLGLITFWIPVFAKKGSRLHINAGRVFVYSGYWVTITALASAVFVMVDPITFQTMRGATETDAAPFVDELRFLYSLLGFLAINVLGGLTLGVRVLRTKNEPEKLGSPGMKLLIALSGLTGLSLLIFGVWHMRTYGVFSGYLVSCIIGVLGILDCIGNFRFFANPRPTPKAWFYKHMECMLACGIGFHTAFLVFGASRYIPAEWLPGAFRLIPWVLPSAIGVPVIHYWVTSYKRKFGELEADGTADSTESSDAQSSG